MEFYLIFWIILSFAYSWALSARIRRLSDEIVALQHKHDELERVCKRQFGYFGYWTIG